MLNTIEKAKIDLGAAEEAKYGIGYLTAILMVDHAEADKNESPALMKQIGSNIDSLLSALYVANDTIANAQAIIKQGE
jgi:hypothetical protein